MARRIATTVMPTNDFMYHLSELPQTRKRMTTSSIKTIELVRRRELFAAIRGTFRPPRQCLRRVARQSRFGQPAGQLLQQNIGLGRADALQHRDGPPLSKALAR